MLSQRYIFKYHTTLLKSSTLTPSHLILSHLYHCIHVCTNPVLCTLRTHSTASEDFYGMGADAKVSLLTSTQPPTHSPPLTPTHPSPFTPHPALLTPLVPRPSHLAHLCLQPPLLSPLTPLTPLLPALTGIYGRCPILE
jgi:hypothetical protein